MKKYIAFLRAINVGGHNVKMDDLKAIFESLGLSDVATFIASGNVIFRSEDEPVELQSRIETHLSAALGYEVDTFLRTDDELAAIAEVPVFDETRLAASKALNVGFLKQALEPDALAKFMSLKSDIDDFQTTDREVYWLCKMKQSESKFSNNLFEKTLNLRATFRGIRTIERLAAKYPPDLNS